MSSSLVAPTGHEQMVNLLYVGLPTNANKPQGINEGMLVFLAFNPFNIYNP